MLEHSLRPPPRQTDLQEKGTTALELLMDWIQTLTPARQGMQVPMVPSSTCTDWIVYPNEAIQA